MVGMAAANGFDPGGDPSGQMAYGNHVQHQWLPLTPGPLAVNPVGFNQPHKLTLLVSPLSTRQQPRCPELEAYGKAAFLFRGAEETYLLYRGKREAVICPFSKGR